ncbi:MAG: MFS transporter [Chloroflexota bacterium]|nr:MFS transporter [Chloroflexota bacterium]
MSDPPRRAYRSLRHRDFRLLWFADAVSMLGTQMQRVAIGWQVYELTGDPLQLGLLGLTRFLPVLLFGLVGGVIADQRDRRLTLLASITVLALSSVILSLTTWTGAASMPLIYGITFFSAAVSAVAGPSRQALFPALVPRAELAGAATLNILAMQTAGVVGPALGGIMIGLGGLGLTYLLDALSFVAVLIALLLMRARPEVPPLRVTGIAAAVEGLKFLWGMPILLAVMALDFFATFFGASTTLLPIFAEQVFGMGAEGYGLLVSAPAAGAVAGSAVMSVLPMPRRVGIGIVVAVAAYGACLLGFGLSRTVWLSLLLLAGSGAADTVSMAFRHTIRNLVTPDQLRGRIAAAHSTFAMGGPQLGEFEAGLVAAAFSPSVSVASGGAATIIACMIIVRLVPTIARYRTDSPPTPAEERQPVRQVPAPERR